MAKRSTKSGGASAEPRDRIVDALMALTAERGLRRVGLADIAGRAGVSLAELRDHYSGKAAIFADFTRRIDHQVLAQGAAEASEDGARDRLFEVMMRRFDALAPYKDAIRRIARAARCDPGLACTLHCIALGSQKWTLAAAGIHTGSCLGRVALHGTVLVYAEVMRVWLDDDEPDLARTMAALDRALRRGERAMGVLSDLCRWLPGMGPRRRPASEGVAA